jgi:CBS domain-containing protein
MTKFAMEKVVRVRDAMTTNVRCIDATRTVGDARAFLLEHRVTGAPVVTTEGHLVGIVTRGDLIDSRHDQPTLGVEHAMTRVLYAVRPEDPLTTAVQLMIDERIHRAVVVDDLGKLIGIVTPMDALRVLLRDELATRRRIEPIEYIKLKERI